MAGIWYCPDCGYEVRGRGGKCHNCRGPLVASPLDELAAGDAEEEVGYSLDEWEDAARGELIAVLITEEIRHRFEGDELVVATDDEDQVDRLIARLGAEGFEDDEHEADPAAGEVLTKLYDAASRLQVDPTDMIADGDLAEAAGGLFSVDEVRGIDEETWAAIGRVTRRLLGALGADEALEDEIVASAGLLSRLLLPIKGTVHGFGEPPAPAKPVATEDVVDADTEAASGDSESDEPGEAAEQHDEMVYELEDWRPEERAQISLLLDGEAIFHQWEGTDLVIWVDDDERVEAILGNLTRTGPTDGMDDEVRYQVLSDLFGAADRLAGNPDDKQKRKDLMAAAGRIKDWGTPFAMSDDEWWKIKLRSGDLVESIELGASRTALEDSATNLRDLLRKYV